ncbi:MAG: hypothetical protein M3O50_16485 [Myxococcota bacterium]|nr:hypothetical protein [Myxococcota bacterium]
MRHAIAKRTPPSVQFPSDCGRPATTARFHHWTRHWSDICVAVLMLAAAPVACGGTHSGSGTPLVSIDPSAGAQSIASPDYVLDLALALEVDAYYVVQSVTGTANLTDGSIAGGGYYVDQGVLPARPSYAELDSAQSTATMTPIHGANPSIAASDFGLVGVDLTVPATRTIVIQRVVANVRSYQTLAVKFTHP